MKFLVAIKPHNYQLRTHSYGVVAEIDWESQSIIRDFKIPAATFYQKPAFMIPALGGLVRSGNRVFVSCWNFIVEFDYETFELVNSLTAPEMTDLHGMAIDGKHLWAAATAIDAVLCYDIDTMELVERWGPDEPILYEERIEKQLNASFWGRFPLTRERTKEHLLQQIKFVPNEYRQTHRTWSPYWNHHLNDVELHNGDLYVTTKYWNRDRLGSIIKVSTDRSQAEFVLNPGQVAGLHDCVFVENKIYVTESGAGGVAWIEPDGQVVHKSLNTEKHFVRGLCDTGSSFLVGMSIERNQTGVALIREYDRTFDNVISEMAIDSIYPSGIGTNIHTIIQSDS